MNLGYSFQVKMGAERAYLRYLPQKETNKVGAIAMTCIVKN